MKPTTPTPNKHCLSEPLARSDQFEHYPDLGELDWLQVLEAAPGFVLILDLDGKIVYINRVLPNLSFESVIGSSAYDYMPASFRGHFEKGMKEVVRTGQPYSCQIQSEGPSGSVSWYDMGLGPIRRNGDVARIFVTAWDVTERITAQDRLAEHREELSRLSAELVLAEERERRKLARYLHDEIGQLLAVARRTLPKDDGESSTGPSTRALIESAIQKTRNLTVELSSPVLYELGLSEAIASLEDQTPGIEQLCFHYDTDPKVPILSEDTNIVLFRIARELIMNVIKHARASNLWVSLKSTGSAVEITIEDDGIGFSAAGAGQRFGRRGTFGFFTIRQQLNQIGGDFVVESEPGRGTRASVQVPLENPSV